VLPQILGQAGEEQHALALVVDFGDVSPSRQQSGNTVPVALLAHPQQGGAPCTVALLNGQPKLQQPVHHVCIAGEVQHALLVGSGDGGVCTGSNQQVGRLQTAVQAGLLEGIEPVMAVRFTQVDVSADGGCYQAVHKIQVVAPDGGDKG